MMRALPFFGSGILACFLIKSPTDPDVGSIAAEGIIGAGLVER